MIEASEAPEGRGGGMRIAVVILALAAIGWCKVHIRRSEMTARHQVQKLRARRVVLRRQLWDRQARMAVVASPGQVRRRIDRMGLDLVHQSESRVRMAGAADESWRGSDRVPNPDATRLGTFRRRE